MAFTIEDTVAVLERTPAALDALLRGLPDHWIRSNEGGDTFTPYDVIGHLIHGEKTDWIARSRIILDHGETRPFERYDRFAQFRESQGKSLCDLLDEFATRREANLATLRSWKDWRARKSAVSTCSPARMSNNSSPRAGLSTFSSMRPASCITARRWTAPTGIGISRST